MKTIYKYSFGVGDFDIIMPKDAKLLCVNMQDNKPYMWVICDNEGPALTRKFKILGTGWKIDSNIGEYVGTIFDEVLGYVWHVFDLGYEKI